MSPGSGPLKGLRVVEFSAIGPVPYCGMLLADLGAEVLRVDRPGAAPPDRFTVEARGKRATTLDLKSSAGQSQALDLLRLADVALEGMRPGVMERLGLGPDVVLAANPMLVYGRMTGWGQHGPRAQQAGHDINYLALSGALHAIGPPEQPLPPVNLVADFGGGALFLALGVLAALQERQMSGKGQVIDCAMSDGSASLMGMLYGHLARGSWKDARGVNIIDGGAPFYGTYRCADGRWIAVGAIEPAFYQALLQGLGMAGEALPDRDDAANWPALRQRFAERFLRHDRDHWCSVFASLDACVTPVLSMHEAPSAAHHQARGSFVAPGGVAQPSVVPRFSRTPGTVGTPPGESCCDAGVLLEQWRDGTGRA